MLKPLLLLNETSSNPKLLKDRKSVLHFLKNVIAPVLDNLKTTLKTIDELNQSS